MTPKEKACLKIIKAAEKDGEVRAVLEDGTEVSLFDEGVVKPAEVIGKTICEAASLRYRKDLACGNLF